jgi:hypothetical protein
MFACSATMMVAATGLVSLVFRVTTDKLLSWHHPESAIHPTWVSESGWSTASQTLSHSGDCQAMLQSNWLPFKSKKLDLRKARLC